MLTRKTLITQTIITPTTDILDIDQTHGTTSIAAKKFEQLRKKICGLFHLNCRRTNFADFLAAVAKVLPTEPFPLEAVELPPHSYRSLCGGEVHERVALVRLLPSQTNQGDGARSTSTDNDHQ